MSYIVISGAELETFRDFIDLKNLKVKLSLKEGEKQQLNELSGSFTIYANDFDRAYIYYTQYFLTNGIGFLPIYLYNDLGNLISEGYVNLRPKIEILQHIITFNVSPKNIYEKIYKNLSTEYNLADGNFARRGVNGVVDRTKLEFKQSVFTENSGLGSLWLSFTTSEGVPETIYARETYIATQAEVNLMVGLVGWELKDGTTNILIRDWTWNFRVAVFPDDFTYFTDSIYYDLHYINDQLPNATSFLSTYTIISVTPNAFEFNEYYQLINADYYQDNRLYYDFFFRLFDVIEWLLLQVDSSIVWTGSGSTGPFWTDDFNNLLICDIATVIAENKDLWPFGGSPTSEIIPSSNIKISLEKIFRFIKERFGYEWYLDDWSNPGLIVFQFKKFVDFVNETNVLPCHDLTSYMGNNFSEDVSEFEVNKDLKYDRIVTHCNGQYIDFTGVDIIFPQIKEVNNLVRNEDVFFTDISDIYFNSGKYNETSTNQFVLLDTVITTDVMKYADGALSGKLQMPNGRLAIANMQAMGMYSRMSDKSVIINNISLTLGDEYLEKYNEITEEIEIPSNDFANDFVLTQYVKTDLSDNCEIVSVEYDNEKETAKIKLKF